MQNFDILWGGKGDHRESEKPTLNGNVFFCMRGGGVCQKVTDADMSAAIKFLDYFPYLHFYFPGPQ